jgi:hypothetical protein
VRPVYESNRAESVMPGRLVAGPWTLNPGTGVRIAPRQPVWKHEQRRKFAEESSRSGEGYGYFSWKETYRIRKFTPQNCEVIQLARITGSDPVHARSNRALAAKFRTRSQSLAAGYLTVYQEGRVQLPLRPP